MLIVVSNREPYLHETAEDGSISAVPTTGGVAVALDALMRERGGTWIAHGAGSADRAGLRRPRSRPRAAGIPRIRPASHLAVRGGRAPVLRRVLQRRTVAALPHGPREAGLPRRRLGRLPGRQPPVRRSDCRRPGRSGDAGVHPGLPPGPGGEGAAHAQARRAHRDLLAHPLAASRPAPHVPVSPRDRRRPARERSRRLPARTRSAQLPERGQGRASPRHPRRRRPRGRAHDDRRRRADRRGLRSDQQDGARSPAARGEGSPAARAAHRRADRRHRRRSPRLHQGDSRAARRDRPAADGASGAAGAHGLRPDWRAVALEARKLCRDREGDRREGGGDQRAPRPRAPPTGRSATARAR